VPYINGKRVSNDEWSKYHGSNLQLLHTGPTGVNPASAPEVDEAGAPAQKKAKRSPRSAKAAKAAIAETLGVKEDSAMLDDIDVTGLEEPAIEEAE
jgi:hypothetical protein